MSARPWEELSRKQLWDKLKAAIGERDAERARADEAEGALDDIDSEVPALFECYDGTDEIDVDRPLSLYERTVALHERAQAAEARVAELDADIQQDAQSTSNAFKVQAAKLTVAFDYIQELEKRLAESQAGGWQPIETAPKDGTDILVLNEEGVFEASADDGRWIPLASDYHGCGCCSEAFEEPSHWMPLPPPPAGGESEPTATSGAQGEGGAS